MSTRPSVGSVMRDRILSSVLLPAPLRPMMPTTSPCLTSKETSSQRPDRSSASSAAASPRRSGAQRRRSAVRSAVAQRAVARARCADAVLLAEAVATRIGQCRSCVTRRPRRSAPCGGSRAGRRPAAATTPTATRGQQQRRAAAAPSSAQRKPSTTPVIGLRPYRASASARASG